MRKLRHALPALVVVLAQVFGLAAQAQDDVPDSIHFPARVTAGVADQLLGQLGPDEHTLYYVANTEASTSIYRMDLVSGNAKLLFEEGAETTWPRPSPDGKTLLYVSYRDQAAGQLCLRDLPSTEHRRCLADTGALQAEWISGSRIALVERMTQGDVQMVEVTIKGDQLLPQPLVPRSVTSPAVSPDGRWLVYIPIDREVSQVGADFAARAAAKLEIVRLDDAAPARPFSLALPGVTAQPAFSYDGHFLYFAQFLADTNHDGSVDAADHGVLFRVPFDSAATDPAAALDNAVPEQLTDGSWNCQYPFAGKERLLATCAQGDTLDVFELPLSGEIPEDWNNDRVRVEVELATETSEQLLLYRRMITRAKSAAGHSLGLLRLVSLHLDRAEFQAAHFYALEAAAKEDPAVRGLGRRMVAWVDHRRQVWEREQGRDVSGFTDASRDRLALLAPEPGDSPAAIALGHLVGSDIAMTQGDFDRAKTELEAVDLPAGTSRPLLELTYRRADALYRLLDDREDLLRWCRKLALFPKAPADVQLRFARAYARALMRGLSPVEADAVFAREITAAPADSELAFALQLGRTLLLIRDEKGDPGGKQARAAIVALYDREPQADRRHSLVSDAIARANELGVDHVIEALAQKYVEDAKPGTAEHQRAEILYRHAILGRAFRRRSKGHYPEARADFDLVVKHTHALEALVGWMDLGLRAGEPATAIAAELEKGKESNSVKVFGRVYLLAHDLKTLTGAAHVKAVEQAVTLLRTEWKELHNQRLARALIGSLRHEAFLVTGDQTDAQRAATNYAIAYKGLRSNVRLKAMLLGELGLLHTEVGNFRLALTYLDQREKLPYIENTTGLAIRLARARALLHIGKEADAAAVADEAVVMATDAPKLAEYRRLALDRAALYHLAAGQFELALSRYEEELALPGAEATGPAEARNALVVRLGRAAAALGAKHPERALGDISTVALGLRDPATAPSLRWKHSTLEQSLRAYDVITAGLEANALLQLGRHSEATQALERRQKLLGLQFGESQRDADERALILVEDRLAAEAATTGDQSAATTWAQRALVHADGYANLTGSPLPTEQADALWLAGQLAAFADHPTGEALAKQLGDALDTLADRGEPRWHNYRHWFELCLALSAEPAATLNR